MKKIRWTREEEVLLTASVRKIKAIRAQIPCKVQPFVFMGRCGEEESQVSELVNHTLENIDILLEYIEMIETRRRDKS